MTTKCHAELSLIYFTIQILRYAQYDEKLLVILRAAPEESISNQREIVLILRFEYIEKSEVNL